MNKKTATLLKTAGGYLFSVLCGLTVSGIVLALFSLAMYILGLPPETAGGLAFVSFAAGCFAGGAVCGFIRQRGGLRCGLVCAAAMTAVVFVISAFTGGLSGGSALLKLLTAVAASCTGAVWSVNRR